MSFCWLQVLACLSEQLQYRLASLQGPSARQGTLPGGCSADHGPAQPATTLADQEAGALLAIDPQGLFCCASGAPVLSMLRRRRQLTAAALAAYRSAILVNASRTFAVGAVAAILRNSSMALAAVSLCLGAGRWAIQRGELRLELSHTAGSFQANLLHNVSWGGTR